MRELESLTRPRLSAAEFENPASPIGPTFFDSPCLLAVLNPAMTFLPYALRLTNSVAVGINITPRLPLERTFDLWNILGDEPFPLATYTLLQILEL